MRVEPELRAHNKFKRLKKIVGDGAMEFVIAIWGHCQSNQRGGFWAGADADYVEMLCDWDGAPGVLFRGLVECGRPKAGFIEVKEDGLLIHDWDAMNATFVANWKNGSKGGRPKIKAENRTETQTGNGLSLGLDGGSTDGSKPLDGHNPSETQSEPNGNRLETHRKPTAPNRTSPDLTKLSSGSETQSEPNGNRLETQGNDFERARGLVALLNELTGSRFDPPIQDLDGITGRMLEVNRDWAGVEKMLRRQVALWKNDAKARHWLKPGTLFGANFHDYYGQRELPVAGGEKNARPRGEILQQLAAAREQNAPAGDIEALERELRAA